MDVTDFKRLLKSKKVLLLTYFNVDLMHCYEHKPTHEFLGSLASQERNQEFFSAREVSENKGASTNT